MSEGTSPGGSTSPRPGPARARTFRRTFGLIVGVVLFGILVLIAILAPLLLSEPATTVTREGAQEPSWQHLFGTDQFGRDMLARSLVATRLTLIMTTISTAISVVSGVLLGTGIWLAPRRIRELGLRGVEIAISYPGLLVALIITAIIGAGSVAVVIGVGIAGIPVFARLTANLASDVSRRDYVTTARLLGVPGVRIIGRHVLPNIAEPMLILVASGFAVHLIELSGVSFVGLGVQSPDYDYGKLLVDALPAIYTRPYEVFGPALMIVITILSVMLIGDGLAASADPRSAARTRKRVRLPRVERTARSGDGETLVSVEDLRVTTDRGQELLHGVSFQINAGEIVGVVGESGSGKSVMAMALAKLLADGLTASAAELRLGEMDLLRPVDSRKLATTVALVYQDPSTTFSPALRMGTQLAESLRSHAGLPSRTARARVLQALDTVHIVDPPRLLRQHPHELSGGMRQRAMIAAALVGDPALIIADEPTTALDVTVQAEILREFTRINRERSTSILFISHDIGVVEDLCDRILLTRDGHIVEELTHDQLIAGDVRHPYTRSLIAATPRISDPKPVHR